MNHRASVILMLAGMVACTVPPPVPAATPTLAPNRIETGVAGTKTVAAEGTAVANTLIAEASQVTREPSPSKTLELTFTRLPPSPTATNTRASALTGTRIPEGTVVQGSVYGIKLKGVKKTDSYTPQIPSDARPVYPGPDHIFLEVGVEFYKNGILVWDDKERLELSVVDSKGNTYQIANQEQILLGVDIDLQTGKITPRHYMVYFSVPNTATGFKLRYRDLSAIDLGL